MKERFYLDNDEARVLARKMLRFNFHQALWFKKQLENTLFYKNGTVYISPSQLNILWAIHIFKCHALPELSAFLLTSKSSLSITITKMVKEGYLKKEIPAVGEDRRKIYFYATEAGIDILNSIEKNSVDALADFCRTLSDEKKKHLDIGLHQLSQIYE